MYLKCSAKLLNTSGLLSAASLINSARCSALGLLNLKFEGFGQIFR